MSNVDSINQADSPSLSIGVFRTGTGRARQTPGKIYTSDEEEEEKKKEFDLSNTHQVLNDRVTLY
jgi:hypothetical protein